MKLGRFKVDDSVSLRNGETLYFFDDVFGTTEYRMPDANIDIVLVRNCPIDGQWTDWRETE